MNTAVRSPLLEWSRRAAASDLGGLQWVEAPSASDAEDYEVVHLDGQIARFRALPLARWLPPALGEAAVQASGEGEATLLEALEALFARPIWMVLGRRLFWLPNGPSPQVLAHLVEAYGIGAEVHGGDRDRLARLAARAPAWFPLRGRLDQARSLLRDAGLPEPAGQWTGGGAATPRSLPEEAMVCRSTSWWAARKRGDGEVTYRIHGGVLRFQALPDPEFAVPREDVLVELPAGPSPSLQLLRLLPAWTTVRVVRRLPKVP